MSNRHRLMVVDDVLEYTGSWSRLTMRKQTRIHNLEAQSSIEKLTLECILHATPPSLLSEDSNVS